MSELVGVSKAAALHGIAINNAYPSADRLQAAIQALDIYEQEYDTLVAERDRLREELPAMKTELVERLYDAALNARQSIDLAGGNDRLRLRMEHYLEADCGCIAKVTDKSIFSIREEVEHRYGRGTVPR